MIFKSLQVKAGTINVRAGARHIGFRVVKNLPLRCLGTLKIEMRSEGGFRE